jgi:HK97 family phage portal protein
MSFFNTIQKFFGQPEANTSTPPVDNDFWYEDLGTRTEAGKHISVDLALQVSAVYSCVRILSESIASLPLYVYQETADNSVELARSHPIYSLLHSQPNSYQTSFQFFEMCVAHIALRGNAYSYIRTGQSGWVTALEPIHPELVFPRWGRTADGKLIPQYVVLEEAGEKVYLQDEILHLKGLTLDGLIGVSPITYMRECISLAVSTERFGARFFKNFAKPVGVLKMPGVFKDQVAVDRFKKGWYAAQGGLNQNSIAVLEGGMEWQSIGISNEDAQFLEARRYQIEEIARFYRVPLHLLQDLTRTAYSTLEQQNLAYLIHTLTPWIVRIEKSLNSSLLTDSKYFAKFDMSSLSRGDTASRYTAYASAINAGWLTRNEARQKEQMNRLPGLDAPLHPLHMGTEGNVFDKEVANEICQRMVAMERDALVDNAYRMVTNPKSFKPWAVTFYEEFQTNLEKLLKVPEGTLKGFNDERLKLISDNEGDLMSILQILREEGVSSLVKHLHPQKQ